MLAQRNHSNMALLVSGAVLVSPSAVPYHTGSDCTIAYTLFTFMGSDEVTLAMEAVCVMLNAHYLGLPHMAV